jgi:hypothetical protein
MNYTDRTQLTMTSSVGQVARDFDLTETAVREWVKQAEPGRAGRPGQAKRWKKTTISDPAAAARADRIRRDFTADASKLNTRWCGGYHLFGSGRGYVLSGWRSSSGW